MLVLEMVGARFGGDGADHFEVAGIEPERKADGHQAPVEHFERVGGEALIAALDDARAIDAVGDVGEIDLAALGGDLGGDHRTVEQHARQIDRLLGLRVGDDDDDLARIGLRQRRSTGPRHERDEESASGGERTSEHLQAQIIGERSSPEPETGLRAG